MVVVLVVVWLVDLVLEPNVDEVLAVVWERVVVPPSDSGWHVNNIHSQKHILVQTGMILNQKSLFLHTNVLKIFYSDFFWFNVT